MKQISLAQALKEKNRIVGEIAKLWTMVGNENSCWEIHTRSIDVNETVERIEFLTQKLIELKTKIGKANEGNLENMYRLEECKSQISRYNGLDTTEDVRYRGINDNITEVRTAEITAKKVIQRTENLQRQCDVLQDELDAYNATHKIEFESPLK